MAKQVVEEGCTSMELHIKIPNVESAVPGCDVRLSLPRGTWSKWNWHFQTTRENIMTMGEIKLTDKDVQFHANALGIGIHGATVLNVGKWNLPVMPVCCHLKQIMLWKWYDVSMWFLCYLSHRYVGIGYGGINIGRGLYLYIRVRNINWLYLDAETWLLIC